MKYTILFAAMAMTISAQASLPQGAGPKCTDAAGQNPGDLAGKGTGNQFATGCCLSDKDCATGCCGKNTGICQNLGVAVQPQVGGCGGTFGGGGGSSPPPPPTQTTTAPTQTTAAAPAQTTNGGGSAGIPAGAGPKCTDTAGQNPGGLAGKGTGNQFATGCCLSDKDCATGCCGKKTGICQNLGVAVQPEVGGCGGTFGT